MMTVNDLLNASKCDHEVPFSDSTSCIQSVLCKKMTQHEREIVD